jgi:hypothetical protein
MCTMNLAAEGYIYYFNYIKYIVTCCVIYNIIIYIIQHNNYIMIYFSSF